MCESIDVSSNDTRTREVVIACPPTLSLNLLRHLQQRATQERQSYLFHIKPCTSNVAELIKQQYVDIAVTYSAYNTEQLTSSLIARSDAYMLVARREHPLLNSGLLLQVEDIFDYPYMSFSGDEHYDAIDPLESYALDSARDLDVVGKVCLLADLMLQLEQSNAVALLCHRDSIEF
ncbi:LysR substrate-binding domain-containing protein, partial [Shewanella sp. 0m-11]